MTHIDKRYTRSSAKLVLFSWILCPLSHYMSIKTSPNSFIHFSAIPNDTIWTLDQSHRIFYGLSDSILSSCIKLPVPERLYKLKGEISLKLLVGLKSLKILHLILFLFALGFGLSL